MTKFTIALREIGTYKEVLRSQVIVMPYFYLISYSCDMKTVHHVFMDNEKFYII